VVSANTLTGDGREASKLFISCPARRIVTSLTNFLDEQEADRSISRAGGTHATDRSVDIKRARSLSNITGAPFILPPGSCTTQNVAKVGNGYSAPTISAV
jgi:hypothetical protein